MYGGATREAFHRENIFYLVAHQHHLQLAQLTVPRPSQFAQLARALLSDQLAVQLAFSFLSLEPIFLVELTCLSFCALLELQLADYRACAFLPGGCWVELQPSSRA